MTKRATIGIPKPRTLGIGLARPPLGKSGGGDADKVGFADASGLVGGSGITELVVDRVLELPLSVAEVVCETPSEVVAVVVSGPGIDVVPGASEPALEWWRFLSQLVLYCQPHLCRVLLSNDFWQPYFSASLKMDR